MRPITLAGAVLNGVSYGQVDAIREDPNTVVSEFALMQNFPNPFNPLTTIRYALPRHMHVSLAVFKTLGEKVADLVDSDVDAGYHELRIDARNLSSGVYFCRLATSQFTETKKLIVLR